MRYDAGNSPEHWDAYWAKSKSRVERYAMQRAVQEIEKVKASSVLDVGCGNGKLLASVKSDCRKYGIDISHVAIENMFIRYEISGETMSAYDIGKLKDHNFDFIVANHILEHLQEDKEFIEICYKLLVPQGNLFIAVPNNMSTPEETDEHVRVYNQESLLKLVGQYFTWCSTEVIGHHLIVICHKSCEPFAPTL